MKRLCLELGHVAGMLLAVSCLAVVATFGVVFSACMGRKVLD